MTPTPSSLTLHPGSVTLAQLRAIWTGGLTLTLPESARAPMLRACQQVQAIIAADQVVYGVNTGFGRLASTRIANDQLAQLQRNLVLSHAVGIGEPLPDAVVRLVLAAKAISLARGHSGVRPDIVDALLALFNAGVAPVIPAKGSVGASGDLAPLAHLACVLIGEGQARVNGVVVSGRDALAHVGLTPFELAPKEGLALLNGTQVSTALALAGLFQAENVFAAGLVAGGLTLQAVKGSIKPFDARIHAARGQPGQIAVAQAVRDVMANSPLTTAYPKGSRVQDPYSLRCIPQVMGACLDNLTQAARTLAIEANAASDNPLVFEDGEVISGGNFHAEPVAFAADIIALALAEIGAMSERRLALLLDTHLSGLPAFLVQDSGVNSGFMIAQVTAAALAAENQCLAHPSSVTSLPTSANQEDHVSMATYGARRLTEMAQNTATITGIEAMAGAQGMDFDANLAVAPALADAHRALRARIAPLEADRYLAPDIAAARDWALADNNQWPEAITSHLPSYAH